MSTTKYVSQETPIITQDIADIARTSSGAYVIVSGEFLIEHGIAESWAKWRKISESKFKPEGFIDGKITPDFEDRIFISLAEQIGLIATR